MSYRYPITSEAMSYNEYIWFAAEMYFKKYGKSNITLNKLTNRIKYYYYDNETVMVYENGDVKWLDCDGKLHRNNGEPAVILSTGDKEWFVHGKCHRDNDEAAIIGINGYMCWYKHGLKHRDNDNPAMIYPNGDKCWYKKGKLYRNNNKSVIEYADGTKENYVNGKLKFVE
jgi:hypothetical protein